MSDLEEYGLSPNKDISELKKHVKNLENKDSVSSNDLFGSMNSLTKSMNSMLQLFKTAADEMKLEEHEEHSLSQNLNPIGEKLDEIIEQNKIIAEGMVALSDLIKDLKISKPSPPRTPPSPPPNNPFPPPQNMPTAPPFNPVPENSAFPPSMPENSPFPPPQKMSTDSPFPEPSPFDIPEPPKKKKGWFK